MLEPAVLAGLNHLLDSASWARAKLAPYANRRARFVTPPFMLALAIDADGRFTAIQGDEAADVVIRLPADAPLRLLQGIGPLMAAAEVDGNAEFATELSFVLRNLRWDAEEDLSKIIGDIAAHRVVRGAQQFVGWQRQAAVNLADNLGEYLKIENPLLASNAEYAQWREGLDQLQAGIARLERQIASLSD